MGSDRLADDFSDFIDAAFADELSKQGDGCGREVAQGVSKTRKRKRATPDVDSTCGSKVCKGGKHNKSNQNTTGSSTVRKCGNGNKSNHDATSASKVRKGSKVNESAQACPSNQGQSACNRRVMSAEAKAKRSDNRKGTRSTETANRTKKRHAEKAEGEDRQNEWRTTRTNRKLRRSESDQSLIDGAMASCESIANTMVDDAKIVARQDAEQILNEAKMYEQRGAKMRDSLWKEALETTDRTSHSEGYKDGERNAMLMYVNDRPQFDRKLREMLHQIHYHPLKGTGTSSSETPGPGGIPASSRPNALNLRK